MYPAPFIASALIPSVTTASVATYPTTLLLNTAAPSIVYERKIGAPVYPNFVPLIGIDCQKKKNTPEYIDEGKIDDLIKKRVGEQIAEYQNRERGQKLEKVYVYKDCDCNCKRPIEEKELTLDEKIEQIRDELNLTKERDENKLIKKLHEYQKRYEKATNTEKIDSNWSYNSKDDYKINYLESKPRNDVKLKRIKSRSPSRNRSPWIPTGSNDYSHTNSKREELFNKQRNYIPFDSELSTSLVFFDNEKPKPNKQSIITVETYKPAQTIFETTIDSKTTTVERPLKEYYCTTNYVTDHAINSKSNYNYVPSIKKEPLYYDKTIYPLAKEYYYYPINRNKSFHM